MSINKILTSQYQDLTEEEIAILQHTLGPVIGGGLEGYWRPEVTQLGNLTWTWSNASTANPPAGMNIKGDKGDTGDEGPQGPTGPQGPSGKAGENGKTPELQINSSNAHWQWRYTGDPNWTDLGVVASGAVGPKGPEGDKGDTGDNGTSIRLVGTETVVGGTQVTLGWGTSDTSAFVIPSGAAGTPGTNGVSPTVALTPIQDQQYPQGGWNVTITDAEHQSGQTFQIFNGIDGQGATVDLVEGNGIQITHQSGTTDYTIGVSADYALKSELPDVRDMATKTWVSGQGYLKSVPDSYATKTYANEASAYALSQAESWVETEGYLKQSALNDYATKTYADSTSAEALSQAKSWVNLQNFATSAGLADDKQFAMTTSGWKEVQGGGGGGETNIIESIRLEGDSTDVTITDKKAMIPLATASATGVAGNTGVITKDDKAHLDAAVEYKENPYDSSSPKALVPQQMFVCESDQQIIDIVTNHSDLINGKGTIFFRITGV